MGGERSWRFIHFRCRCSQQIPEPPRSGPNLQGTSGTSSFQPIISTNLQIIVVEVGYDFYVGCVLVCAVSVSCFAGCWRWLWVLCKASAGHSVLSAKLLRGVWQCRWNDECGWVTHVLFSGVSSSTHTFTHTFFVKKKKKTV